MNPPTLRQRLLGLAATLAILLLLAGVPFLLVAIGAAPWHTDPAELRALLLSPDDGTLAMVVIAAVAWIAWAFVAISVVLEAVAHIRGLPAPSLPGLHAPQAAVGRLVAVAALLFMAPPTVVAAFPAPPAHAVAAAPAHHAPPPAAASPAPVLPQAAPAQAAVNATSERSTIDYTVKRGDSLWKIADRLLGDGTRFPEIVDLNATLLGGRPDFITPGVVLKVPRDAPAAEPDPSSEEYVVQPGDTLSEIAEATLGDPMRYPELFDATRSTVQPDGARLTDPDLIRPGWQITIPGQSEPETEVTEQPAVADVPPPAAGPTSPPPTAATPTAEPTQTPAPTDAADEPSPESAPDPTVAANDKTADDEAQTTAPGWLLPGLSGAGAVLAALVLLAIRAHHNTQLRYRRPGQVIAPPPDELRALEKTAFIYGAPLTAPIEQLNRALNHLAAAYANEGQPPPELLTATLAPGSVTLRLVHDGDLPQPWTGSGREWTIRLDESLPDDPDVLPPYPMLVTIGCDATGVHLLNLEQLGIVALTGDPDRAIGLARHIAAELALNPWSTLVEVTVIGFGDELAPLDQVRLHHHRDGNQIVPSLARDLERSRGIGWGDPDPYRVILTTSDGTAELAPLLTTPAPWVGAALLTLSAPVPEATEIHVDRAGQLRTPALGLDLQAAGLTSEEATACAAIVDLTRESAPVKTPTFEQPTTGWRALADQAGALREELTEPRDKEGPAGEASLLPKATQDYTATAATTTQDIETLAPVVDEQVARTVQEADPTLDDDLADWLNPTSSRPRLTVLGPVSAKAFGQLTTVITKRKPYFVEILAYLALHPKGATASEIADAFGIAASRARTDISSLRTWLGADPQTGQPYLPAANETPTYLETGVKTYQLREVLVDLDLFRRLRVRGQARGAEGIDDLKTAMSLVQGPPFSLLREKGWSWLLDTERVHETISSAIVDTAHVLVTDALAKGDLDVARQVAEVACQAAPYDEVCRLDLIKVTEAEGNEEAADKMLNGDIFNRTDDYLPPIELPKRTSDVLVQRARAGKRRRP